MKKIENLFLNNDLIIIGELHGTKEIPNLLLKIMKEFYKKADFIVCLEIPKEFQKNAKKYFLEERMGDGRASAEYFNLIKELNKIGIEIVFVDNYARNQQEKENNLANNIMNVLKRKIKTIAVLGDFHAYKKKFIFSENELHAYKNFFAVSEREVLPAAYLLNKKIKRMANIRIVAKRGKIFNNGIKEVGFSKSDPLNSGFDLIYILKSVSPCTFLE